MNKDKEGVSFLTGKDFANAGTASSSLKKMLEEMKIPPEIVRRAAIAAFEAEMNINSTVGEGTTLEFIIYLNKKEELKGARYETAGNC